MKKITTLPGTIGDYFTVNKYYRMSDKDLELEASKYQIGGYSDGRRVIRDEIIKQLLNKDQANDSRIAIGISLASFFIAGISLWFTFGNLQTVNKQTYLMHAETLPQIKIAEGQIKDDAGIFADNQLRIYNYGKPLHNLEVETTVFIQPDSEVVFDTEKLRLNGYFFASRPSSVESDLMLIIEGVPRNNELLYKLSREFHTEYGSFLSPIVYVKVDYKDSLDEPHTDYYTIKNSSEAEKISQSDWSKEVDGYQGVPNVELSSITAEHLGQYLRKK